MPEETNDNDGVNGVSPWANPDPHGQAALVLCESLLHVLIEKGVLTSAEAVDIVETAQDVKIEIADDMGEPWQIKRASLALLSSISLSLRSDVP